MRGEVEIQSAKLSSDGRTILLNDGRAAIQNDAAAISASGLQAWLDAGNQIAPADPLTPAPPEQTPTRIDDLERALIAKGALSSGDITQAKRNRP